jgi:glycerophosphoryl diester phosphodiesterase
MVQLIDGDDVDLKTGKITYAMPFDRPYDWVKAGDSRLFAAMVTPAGLAEIRTYADGIGPWKPYIVPVKGRLDSAGRLVDVNGDGKIDLRDASTQPATTLVADAHEAGLFVHTFAFRNEKRRLASDYRGNPQAEYLQFFRLGVDGVFADFPDTAGTARAAEVRAPSRARRRGPATSAGFAAAMVDCRSEGVSVLPGAGGDAKRPGPRCRIRSAHVCRVRGQR